MSTIEDTPPAVAVIGMAGRFPGARDVLKFWENLRNGVESITFFSEEEMAQSGVDSSIYRGEGYVPARGVAPDLDLFDAAFFGFTPREAELMDPQHRVFLECAWEALEDAGIDPDRYAGAIGVYAGTSISTYLINNIVPTLGGLGAGAIQVALSNDKDHVPTRVSYKLNLRGPSVNVQTACSTSLVATHLACQSLLSGECDVALAGGSSVTVPLRAGYRYEEGSILSPDGHCRAFDAASDGTVGGSGVAIVVLKRLEDALRDRDTIHAVIRGSAINNDGSVKVGYTAPSIDGQAEVIAQAHGVAEVEPDTITYVEAHGTATPLGDPIEVAALTRAFRLRTDRSHYCAIGSVKTNVGHMDAAAGVTGLIKTVFALEHAEIPPSLHYASPNPQIDFESTPFYVNAELAAWNAGEVPRRAGVSSFGIGGTNVHVVLEEAPKAVRAPGSRSAQLLVVSARNGAALQEAAARLADRLERFPDLPLEDVAYTLQTGRRAFGRRASLVCTDSTDAVAGLRAIASETAARQAAVPGRPIVFMFSGQGSQHVGMGRRLYEIEPTFRRHVDECLEILRPVLGVDLGAIIYPDDPDSPEAQQRLTDTRFAQPALFVVEYALAQLWFEWGIRPQAMIGHSIGEYTAACLAGVFSVEDALRLVAERGRLMAQQPPGSMLAVPLPLGQIDAYLRDGISLAAVNQAGLSVVSGPTEAIEALAGRLGRDGVEGRRLHTSHAFHSSMMDPAVEPFRAEVARVALRAPTLPFISCVSGRMIDEADATDPAYWARHLREPVRFADGLDALLDRMGDAVLVEVGPSQALSALSRRHRANPPVIPSLPHADSDGDDAESALRAAGRLWEHGASIDWVSFHRREPRRKVPLPTYPFQRQRYWIEAGATRPSLDGVEQPGKLPDVDDWLYAPVWREVVAESPPAPETARRWLILGADVSAGSRVSDFLRNRGTEVVSVVCGTEVHEDPHGHFVMDPGDPAHFVELLDRLDGVGRAPDVILHAWGAQPPPEGERGPWSDGVQTRELSLGVLSLIGLAQALVRRGSVQPLRLAALTTGAVDGPGAQCPLPFRAAALGPLKVIPQELAHVTTACVDVDDAGVALRREADLDRIVSDLVAPAPPPVVAYRGRRRFVEAYERVRPEAGPAPSLLRDGGAYLILGGLGGVGLEVARQLHGSCGARLALTTRHAVSRDARGRWREQGGANEQALAEVHALQDLGAEVLLVSTDVTDPAQVEAALTETRKAFGAVNGVVFAAGAPKSPTPFVDGDLAAIEAQLRPRINGMAALARAVRSEELDFCLVQSSLATVLGAGGFVGYAAAHLYMDAFAAATDRLGRTPWITVDWDNWITWKDAHAGIERAAEFFMTREEGGTALERVLALASRHQRLIVSTGSLSLRVRRWINPSADTQLDARAAPESARYARPDTGEPYEAPTTETEVTLAEIWADVLGIERVGIHDDFFELGGDSVLGIQVVAKSRRAGLHLSAQQIFEHPTIAQMARVVGSQPGAVDAEQGPVAGPVPLTPIQRWFFEQDIPERHHFNMPMLLEASDVDLDRLSKAVRRLLEHHDALRLRYESTAGVWRQYGAGLDEESDPVVDFVDLSGTPPDRLLLELAASATAFQGTLELSAGPMLRTVLFRMGRGMPDRVLLIAHHLVVDAVSWRVLLEDLNAVYTQLERGAEVALPPKTTSFKRWSEALEAYARSAAVSGEIDLWTEIASQHVPSLPTDLSTGLNTLASVATVRGALSEEETRALLQDVPRALGAKIDEVLLAALATSLTRWTGASSIRIALEGHGREDIGPGVDTSRTVGWFTTLFPVVLALDAPGSAEAAIRAVKAQYRSIPRGGMGYGVLRYLGQDARIKETLGSAPKAEVSLLYLGRYEARGDLPFRVARESPGLPCSPQLGRPHLLDLVAAVVGGRLEAELSFSTNRHASATAERLVAGFVEALQSLIGRTREPREREVVASDFPESGLTQEQLEALIAGMKGRTE
jgi:non-ribosomal peptide synthase protein (TIGR01720 family)